MSEHYHKYKETIDRNTYKWREANKEQWIKYNREYQRTHFHLYKDKKNKKRNAQYQFKKEWQKLLNILNNFFESDGEE